MSICGVTGERWRQQQLWRIKRATGARYLAPVAGGAECLCVELATEDADRADEARAEEGEGRGLRTADGVTEVDAEKVVRVAAGWPGTYCEVKEKVAGPEVASKTPVPVK